MFCQIIMAQTDYHTTQSASAIMLPRNRMGGKMKGNMTSGNMTSGVMKGNPTSEVPTPVGPPDPLMAQCPHPLP
jgi:hypothetical protein